MSAALRSARVSLPGSLPAWRAGVLPSQASLAGSTAALAARRAAAQLTGCQVSRSPPVAAAAAPTAEAASVAEEAPAGSSPPERALSSIASQLQGAGSSKQQNQLLLQFARRLDPLSEQERTYGNRVMGCTSQVWVTARMDEEGRVRFKADSDSALTRGLAWILVSSLSGLLPDDVAQVQPEALQGLGISPALLTPSRSNGFLTLLQRMRKLAAGLHKPLPSFPSLLTSADSTTPQGAFAQAQDRYLKPDTATVDRLVNALSEKHIGVVAHFYMDPEVQGVLTAAHERWPHIHISDSLVMADSAVKMAEGGCTAVAVLGVDFMSENVRAILDEAGYRDVQVYRMASEAIGCSLAEAAESEAYLRYLEQAADQPDPGLHVVYINTSLRTKALAHAQVPTITCTSSNVVQTVLQAFAQVPDLHVWYGPDTYMGTNIAFLMQALSRGTDEEVKALHAAHDVASIMSLLPRLHYFNDGTCIVHHMFGAEVTQHVKEAYPDAFLTAHFEVPGEMFALAMDARKRDAGVVGSTSNILEFIDAKVKEALDKPFPERVQVVLGTESGMITAIVKRVQQRLAASGRSDVDVEIVFPVASEAITTPERASQVQASNGATSNGAASNGSSSLFPEGLAVVPGVAQGEGCSAEGGCASCPYMKMNTLAALERVCALVGSKGEALLEGNKPDSYMEQVNGRSMAAAGCEPILHMRDFQKLKRLPEALEVDIYSRLGACDISAGPGACG